MVTMRMNTRKQQGRLVRAVLALRPCLKRLLTMDAP